MRETVLVLNFGGNAKDIARSIRQAGVYSVIKPETIKGQAVKDISPIGIVIAAATDDAQDLNPDITKLGIPLLKINDGADIESCILNNFLFDICKATGNYNIENYIAEQIDIVRAQTGGERVLLALSGGVDSSVCAALLSRAIPGRTVCVFVDHGLMRLNEGDEVESAFKRMDLTMIRVNARERFLSKLKHVIDPEEKRKLVGAEFIAVFREEAAKLNIPFLAQGTNYADIIESGADGSNLVKSHHNVGGLPKNMGFKELVEPLSMLFKDEVRDAGRKLGLAKAYINRQPFPGPGLSVRVLGEVTEEKLETLRLADAIFCHEVSRLRRRPDQYFAVHTGLRAVGVFAGKRSYATVIALRAVYSQDFMSAAYCPLSHKTLATAASRIINEIPGVGRVVYDITAKPPGTVEWE
ncbi:MAG: glutamine-hydrolyzing GMP synthase [Defluviitaleaceae bacterium]|nr:glutamine-hydrolyzing GMP synthase [Defluviitaleaceae bacterium]MCL2835303.1 glutamine-hydrolyzing GMP synthase [Defluviitaleaceae bacterium]